MKPNFEKYREVKELPPNAMTVKGYADRNTFSTAYVYKLLREGKAKFEMITFQTINFVIPQ